MVLENPLFIIPLSCGIIFCITGCVMHYFPPKKINGLYGYRTANSMKSQERWDFAQVYAAKLLMQLGFLLSLTSVSALIISVTEHVAMIIGLSLMMATVLILAYKVEKKLKQKFEQ